MKHRGTTELWVVSDNGRWSAVAVQSLAGLSPFVQKDNNQILILDTQTQVEPNAFVKEERLLDVPPDALFLKMNSRNLIVLRSRLRMQGLFFGHIGTTLMLSTEQKALRSAGVAEIRRLEPGHLLQSSIQGDFSLTSHQRLTNPVTRPVRDPSKILTRLKQSLLNSFLRIQDQRVGVLFSGGVDSSLAALLAARVCQSVTLFSVFGHNSHDERTSIRAAEILGIEQIGTQIDAETVWQNLPAVVYAIENANRMDVTIALPFYLAAQKATEKNIRLMISGQGPDELFAGYARHVRVLEKDGPQALAEQLWSEVSQTHKRNLERDERAVAHGGCDIFYPYVYEPFIDVAMSLPVEWKIREEDAIYRKYIFRLLACEMGVPHEIAFEPKSATQFSTASDRLLVEAIQRYATGRREISKRTAERMTQAVLNIIASELNVPTSPLKEDRSSVDVEQIVALVAEWKASHQQ